MTAAAPDDRACGQAFERCGGTPGRGSGHRRSSAVKLETTRSRSQRRVPSPSVEAPESCAVPALARPKGSGTGLGFTLGCLCCPRLHRARDSRSIDVQVRCRPHARRQRGDGSQAATQLLRPDHARPDRYCFGPSCAGLAWTTRRTNVTVSARPVTERRSAAVGLPHLGPAARWAVTRCAAGLGASRHRSPLVRSRRAPTPRVRTRGSGTASLPSGAPSRHHASCMSAAGVVSWVASGRPTRDAQPRSSSGDPIAEARATKSVLVLFARLCRYAEQRPALRAGRVSLGALPGLRAFQARRVLAGLVGGAV